jgi:hypothetical protein
MRLAQLGSEDPLHERACGACERLTFCARVRRSDVRPRDPWRRRRVGALLGRSRSQIEDDGIRPAGQRVLTKATTRSAPAAAMAPATSSIASAPSTYATAKGLPVAIAAVVRDWTSAPNAAIPAAMPPVRRRQVAVEARLPPREELVQRRTPLDDREHLLVVLERQDRRRLDRSAPELFGDCERT